MELPTEKNAYVTIAIVDMPFRVQRYGPYGEAHQTVWQQVMERLEQLSVVGWKVSWARVVDRPTNLALLVYHPKHPSKRGPEHDTLFLENIMQPLIECNRHKPRFINLELDIPAAAAFTTPQNGLLTKLFFFDVVTNKSVQNTDDPLAPTDPLSALRIASLRPDQPPSGTIPSRNKAYDLRAVRRGKHLPSAAYRYPNVEHETFLIEFATKKASERFQDPNKPSTGVSNPKQLPNNAWNTTFLQPLQNLQDAGIVIGAERLILESFAWPVVKVANKIEKVPRQRETGMFDTAGVEEGTRDAEKRMGWFDRVFRFSRKSTKVEVIDDSKSEESGGIEEIEEVIQWVKSHSRSDSGYSSGNYSTITTVESIRPPEEEDGES